MTLVSSRWRDCIHVGMLEKSAGIEFKRHLVNLKWGKNKGVGQGTCMECPRVKREDVRGNCFGLTSLLLFQQCCVTIFTKPSPLITYHFSHFVINDVV